MIRQKQEKAVFIPTRLMNRQDFHEIRAANVDSKLASDPRLILGILVVSLFSGSCFECHLRLIHSLPRVMSFPFMSADSVRSDPDHK